MATTTEVASNITNDSNTTENKPSKIIKIQSNDGQIFEIDEGIIEQSSTIKELFDTLPVGDTPIPLPNVKASLLIPIIEFCNYHKNDKKSETIDDDEDDDPNKDMYEPKKSDDISTWDQNFISRFTVQDATLFDIINAANYLGIKNLLTVGLKTIANMVRGKSSSEVRDIFTISRNPADEGLNTIEDASETVSTN